MAQQRKATGVSSEGGFLDNQKQKEIDNKTVKANETDKSASQNAENKEEE